MFNIKNKICKVSLISAGSLINKCNAAEAINISTFDINGKPTGCAIMNNVKGSELSNINLLKLEEVYSFIEKTMKDFESKKMKCGKELLQLEQIMLKKEQEMSTELKSFGKLVNDYLSTNYSFEVVESATQQDGINFNYSLAEKTLNIILKSNLSYNEIYFRNEIPNEKFKTKDNKEHIVLFIEYNQSPKKIYSYECTKPKNEQRKIDKKYMDAYLKVYKDISSKNPNYTYKDIIDGLLAEKDEKGNQLFFEGTEFAFYKEVPGITNGKIDNKYNRVKDKELNEAVSSYLGCVYLNYPVYCEEGYEFPKENPENPEEPGKEKPETPKEPGTPTPAPDDKPKEVKPKEKDLKPVEIPKEKQIDKVPEKILPNGNINPTNPDDNKDKDNNDNKDNKSNNTPNGTNDDQGGQNGGQKDTNNGKNNNKLCGGLSGGK